MIVVIIIVLIFCIGKWSFGGTNTSLQKGLLNAHKAKQEGKITEEQYWEIWDKEMTKYINKYK